MILIPDPLDIERYKNEMPIDEAKNMINIAWELMNPIGDIETHYGVAYAMNLGGYMSGHPEGASNIGLMIIKNLIPHELKEIVNGAHDPIDIAEQWFLRARQGKFHSPQAEINLAKIAAQRSQGYESFRLADYYISEAMNITYEPNSLWMDEMNDFCVEIECVYAQICESFKYLPAKDMYPSKLH